MSDFPSIPMTTEETIEFNKWLEGHDKQILEEFSKWCEKYAINYEYIETTSHEIVNWFLTKGLEEQK